MKTSMTIAAPELIDRYEDSTRRNPETAIRMVMWLMLYDQQPASWARDFLEEVGALPSPKESGERTSQLRKVHRWRTATEESAGLPPRGKRGTTQDYRRALNDWRRLNPRPTKDELLGGWIPQPLPAPYELNSRMKIDDAPTAKKAATKKAPKGVKENPADALEKRGFTPRNPTPATALVKPEERSPEKEKQFAALERMKQKLIPP